MRWPPRAGAHATLTLCPSLPIDCSAELVDRLEALLAEVEKRRKEATDVALYTMIMTMNDVAHIDPQQVGPQLLTWSGTRAAPPARCG